MWTPSGLESSFVLRKALEISETSPKRSAEGDKEEGKFIEIKASIFPAIQTPKCVNLADPLWSVSALTA